MKNPLNSSTSTRRAPQTAKPLCYSKCCLGLGTGTVPYLVVLVVGKMRPPAPFPCSVGYQSRKFLARAEFGMAKFDAAKIWHQSSTPTKTPRLWHNKARS